VRAPLVRLARAGVSPAVAAPPLPAWITRAWIADASRWSVAIWRTDLASGDTCIQTIVVARPGNTGALVVMRAAARHPAFAGLGLLAGAIAAYVAWRPAVVIYVVVVGGLLSVGGLLVPVLRGNRRTAAGEQLGKRGERALADLSTSGENPDAWRRLWTALPVPPAAP